MGTALGIALGVILQNLAFYLAAQHYLGIRLPLRTYWLFGSTQDNA
jgi:hypothetical protein